MVMDDREPFAGQITGLNHVVLVTDDMERTMSFYCGLLKMRVRANTSLGAYHGGALALPTRVVNRIYFLDLPNGGLLVFAEVLAEGPKDTLVHSSMDPLWPRAAADPGSPSLVQKLDHLALNVESVNDLAAVRERLVSAGYSCSPMQRLDSTPFVSSIYLHDPNGIPIEISTWDLGNDARWESIATMGWFLDADPVPSAELLT